MGLTGLITWAQLRLRPIVSCKMDVDHIQFHGIDEFLSLKQQYAQAEYNVSWMDCTSTGRNFARGVFMAGSHSAVPGELIPSPQPKLVFPFDAPAFALNHATVALFNTLYFHKQRASRTSKSRRTSSPTSTRWTKFSTGTDSTDAMAWCSFNMRSPGRTPRRARSRSCARLPRPVSPASSPCSRPSATSPRSV